MAAWGYAPAAPDERARWEQQQQRRTCCQDGEGQYQGGGWHGVLRTWRTRAAGPRWRWGAGVSECWGMGNGDWGFLPRSRGTVLSCLGTVRIHGLGRDERPWDHGMLESGAWRRCHAGSNSCERRGRKACETRQTCDAAITRPLGGTGTGRVGVPVLRSK